MSFSTAILVFSLVFVVEAVGDDFECNGQENYKYPDKDNCRYFYVCKKGSTESRVDACCIFFRKFNPETERCDWCWNVDCSATPPAPPTTPPPVTSPATPPSTVTSPATPPSTVTAAPTSSSTAPSTTTSPKTTSTDSKLLWQLRNMAIDRKH